MDYFEDELESMGKMKKKGEGMKDAGMDDEYKYKEIASMIEACAKEKSMSIEDVMSKVHEMLMPFKEEKGEEMEEGKDYEDKEYADKGMEDKKGKKAIIVAMLKKKNGM